MAGRAQTEAARALPIRGPRLMPKKEEPNEEDDKGRDRSKKREGGLHHGGGGGPPDPDDWGDWGDWGEDEEGEEEEPLLEEDMEYMPLTRTGHRPASARGRRCGGTKMRRGAVRMEWSVKHNHTGT